MRNLIGILFVSVCALGSHSFASALCLPTVTLDACATSAISDISSDSDQYRALSKAVAPDAAEYLATQGQTQSNLLKAIMSTWRESAKTNNTKEILALSDYELVEQILAESLN